MLIAPDHSNHVMQMLISDCAYANADHSIVYQIHVCAYANADQFDHVSMLITPIMYQVCAYVNADYTDHVST